MFHSIKGCMLQCQKMLHGIPVILFMCTTGCDKGTSCDGLCPSFICLRLDSGEQLNRETLSPSPAHLVTAAAITLSPLMSPCLTTPLQPSVRPCCSYSIQTHSVPAPDRATSVEPASVGCQ